MPKSKLTYEETVNEIKELQDRIKAHQDGATIIDDYVGCLKRIQFLRNSLRALRKRKAPKDK
jgi:hypothetical protein